jgi:FtsP/CotA-like multicopper oxidase with cupredoxin domain
MNHFDSRPHRMLVAGLIVGAVAVAASACGGSNSSTPSTNAGATTAGAPATSAPKTVNIELVGKIDTDTGPAGTFTSKEHWPAMAPSDLKFAKGDNVVLTIKEYDDAPTALPDGSPYNAVAGGTMTVDGVATTTVANTDIAHTFSIPELNINVPLSKAPEGKFSTTVFTFTADKTGAFTWHCFTPCGGDPKGMGGSMATKGWMQGNVTVA